MNEARASPANPPRSIPSEASVAQNGITAATPQSSVVLYATRRRSPLPRSAATPAATEAAAAASRPARAGAGAGGAPPPPPAPAAPGQGRSARGGASGAAAAANKRPRPTSLP